VVCQPKVTPPPFQWIENALEILPFFPGCILTPTLKGNELIYKKKNAAIVGQFI